MKPEAGNTMAAFVRLAPLLLSRADTGLLRAIDIDGDLDCDWYPRRAYRAQSMNLEWCWAKNDWLSRMDKLYEFDREPVNTDSLKSDPTVRTA